MAAAYAALTSLINTIHYIQHHPFPPIALNVEQVEYLTENSTFLVEFLQGYESPAACADEADPLEMRIADAAYAAEDFIESRVVDMIELRRSSPIPEKETSWSPSFLNFFGFRIRPTNGGEKPKNPLRLYQDLGKVIEAMDSIKKDAMVMKKQETAVVVAHSSASGVSPSRSSITVGFDGVLLEILDKLTGGDNDRRVIPIVGMGGIGKTTLAKTVFDHALVKDHFDICAWVTISQKYNTKEILCELLSQANRKGKEELSIHASN